MQRESLRKILWNHNQFWTGSHQIELKNIQVLKTETKMQRQSLRKKLRISLKSIQVLIPAFLGVFQFTQSPTPPLSPQTMLDACIQNFFRVSTLHRVGGGRTGIFILLRQLIRIKIIFLLPAK